MVIMGSSYLGKISGLFTATSHPQQQQIQPSSSNDATAQSANGTEFENGACSSSSTAEFAADEQMALPSSSASNIEVVAAMALSSLVNGVIGGGAHFGDGDNGASESLPSSAGGPATSASASPPPTATAAATEEGAGGESGDEVPDEADTDAPVHEIRCGLLTGRLHMQRFTCPGIHRKCVEFEGRLISPRQFTIRAEKDKQKDWKGSIRLGKHNLRTLMEMKTLDFYEHATNCSLKCQSRNYIKNRKAEGNGADGGAMSFVDGIEDGKALSFDLSDANDVHSTTSSSSTRKSSAVLEDFVSQTIPTVNGPFVPLNLGAFCLGNGDEQQSPLKRDPAELRQKTPTHQHRPVVSTPSTGTCSQLNTPCTTSASSATPFISAASNNANIGGGGSAVTTPTNGTFSPAAFGGLLQQSPLKQLFAATTPQNHQKHSTANSAHLQPHMGSFLNISGANKHIVPELHHQQQLENNHSANGANSTLSLLLQSLQASILLEQQAKMNNGGGNAGGAGNLLSLLNGIPSLVPSTPTTANAMPAGANNNSHQTAQLLNGIESALGGGQQQRNGTGPSGGTAMNGIEQLLSAAALFPKLHPQQQQQKTPSMIRQELINGGGASGTGSGNVRRIMEENSSLFWSQMRSMGLLEDMLNTLSATLERLKHIYVNGGNVVSEEFAAKRLSGVALALDLCTLFSDKIHNRCIQATLETNLITKELMELQRKQEEQKRKLESAKRKSQVFELLKNGGTGHGHQNHGNSHQSSVPSRGGGAESPPEMKKIHLNI